MWEAAGPPHVFTWLNMASTQKRLKRALQHAAFLSIGAHPPPTPCTPLGWCESFCLMNCWRHPIIKHITSIQTTFTVRCQLAAASHKFEMNSSCWPNMKVLVRLFVWSLLVFLFCFCRGDERWLMAINWWVFIWWQTLIINVRGLTEQEDCVHLNKIWGKKLTDNAETLIWSLKENRQYLRDEGAEGCEDFLFPFRQWEI